MHRISKYWLWLCTLSHLNLVTVLTEVIVLKVLFSFEWQRERQTNRGGQTCSSIPLVHFSSTYNCHSWARLKPQYWRNKKIKVPLQIGESYPWLEWLVFTGWVLKTRMWIFFRTSLSVRCVFMTSSHVKPLWKIKLCVLSLVMICRQASKLLAEYLALFWRSPFWIFFFNEEKTKWDNVFCF